MSFEVIFITEGLDSTPAAEIQFGGQRLCIVYFSEAASSQIEFVNDSYVGRDVKMIFPLAEFFTTIQLTVDDLALWQKRLSNGRAEA